jgi:hypothetical protein
LRFVQIEELDKFGSYTKFLMNIDAPHHTIKKNFSNEILGIIEQIMKDIKVHFEFFVPRTPGGKWTWKSLMGSAKKTILEKFPVNAFILEERGQKIEIL